MTLDRTPAMRRLRPFSCQLSELLNQIKHGGELPSCSDPSTHDAVRRGIAVRLITDFRRAITVTSRRRAES
jgi:hypothetical protein